MKSAEEMREIMPIYIETQERKRKILSQLEEEIETEAKKDNFSVIVWLSIEDLYKINNDLLELGYMIEDITGCRTIDEWKECKILTSEFRPQFDIHEHCYLFPYRISW